MEPAVTLNREQCLRIAEVIGQLKPHDDFYKREYLSFEADAETKFRMHFFAVAICHHTYSLHHPALNLWGWDFIEHVFLKMARQNAPILDPAAIEKLSMGEISDQLKNWFAHDDNQDHCSLDRLDERAGLMIDAADFLVSNNHGLVADIFTTSEGFLFHSGKGLYEMLPKMEAFSDPQQKKTTFLIKLLMDANLMKINDPENFIPIMDYHMQRVLMRTGCVEITDPLLRRKLLDRDPLPTDEPVRGICIEAFRLIAEASAQPVTRMNDYFWSLGRSCCNNTTLCHDHFCEKTPCTLAQIIQLIPHDRCIFDEICPGATSEAYRNLWQPVVQTHYY